MRHNQPADASTLFTSNRGSSPSSSLTARELAHELNSLLDGSMRSLSLARRAIEAAGEQSAIAEIASRLQLAERALADMANLIAQTLREDVPGPSLFDTDRTIREELDRCIAAVSALAEQHSVELTTHVSVTAMDLPAGPLGAVMLNGLRNAVQAASLGPRSPRQVELSIDLSPRRELMILISDTGPGLPAENVRESRGFATDEPHGASTGGHGIGLELSRRIVSSLGGSMMLMNVPFNAGAVLRVIVPIERLSSR